MYLPKLLFFAPLLISCAAKSGAIVTLNTTPSTASVSIAGKKVCDKSPCKVKFSAVPQDIAIFANGHQSTNCSIKATENMNIDVKLEKRIDRSQAAGRVSIKTTPEKLLVAIDDKKIGRSPIRNHWLPAGEHTISVHSKKCYQPTSKKITIKKDERREFELITRPKSAELEIKIVDKDGKQQRSDIYVDRQHRDKGPTTIKVPACSKTIKAISKDKFGRTKVNLTAKDASKVATIKLDANLKIPQYAGYIDTTKVYDTIKANHPEFTKCYQSANKASSMKGSMHIKYQIEPDGTLSLAKVQGSTFSSTPMHTCIEESFQKLTFPKPKENKGPFIGMYPLEFPIVDIPEIITSQIKRKNKTPHQYPEEAKNLKLGKQSCVVYLTINEKGIPERVEAGYCHEVFRAEAKKTAMQWSFYPYIKDQKPTKARLKIYMDFKKKGKKKSKHLSLDNRKACSTFTITTPAAPAAESDSTSEDKSTSTEAKPSEK